ncbi:ferredoxin, partial [bacterium]|nr:ferredoxin [bacterium]
AAAVPAIAESASAPAAEDEVSFDEPYIDSFLCTSCNECIGINPQMFQYNGNKQAFLADASKGTFDELVRAAEKCPARCIHPAKPRAGDTTVNDDLLKRAAVYN